MLRRPIVPKGDIARPPAVADGEFQAGGMLEQKPTICVFLLPIMVRGLSEVAGK
jgi:hypothetical protein